MHLLSHLLLLCIWLTSRVAAYDVPGAYERVFFYYAYLMEIELYGEPKKISPACGRVMGTGGKPCSYDQWVEFVRVLDPKEKVDKINYPRITGDAYAKGVFPNVHKSAQLTHEQEMTGALEPARVVQGFKADPASDVNSYAQVLQKTAKRVENMFYDAKLPAALRDGGLEAMTSVIYKRMDASVEAFKEKEKKDGRTVTLRERPLDSKHEGRGTVKDFDHAAYLRDNPGTTMSDLRTRWARSMDASHRNNIKALKERLEQMKLSC